MSFSLTRRTLGPNKGVYGFSVFKRFFKKARYPTGSSGFVRGAFAVESHAEDGETDSKNAIMSNDRVLRIAIE